MRKIATRLPRRLAFGLVALALIASAIAGGFVGTADAALEHREITYYSSPAKTEVIGLRMYTCSGHLYRYGSVSPYNDEWSIPCVEF